MEAELAEHLLRELDRVLDLLDDLLGRAEDVRIVLREAAHAEHAVAHAVLLVAVHRAQLVQPQRQLPQLPQQSPRKRSTSSVIALSLKR